MNILPQHPAYADPSFPSSQYRSMHGSMGAIGDPYKAGEVLYKVANDSFNGKELPLRLQLGSDAFYIATASAKKTLGDQKVWADVSHSTNADDHDRGLVEMIKQTFAYSESA